MSIRCSRQFDHNLIVNVIFKLAYNGKYFTVNLLYAIEIFIYHFTLTVCLLLIEACGSLWRPGTHGWPPYLLSLSMSSHSVLLQLRPFYLKRSLSAVRSRSRHIYPLTLCTSYLRNRIASRINKFSKFKLNLATNSDIWKKKSRVFLNNCHYKTPACWSVIYTCSVHLNNAIRH